MTYEKFSGKKVEMIDKIKKLKNQFSEELEKHLNNGTLESLRTKYLSRRGLVTDLFNQMNQVDAEIRPQGGRPSITYDVNPAAC